MLAPVFIQMNHPSVIAENHKALSIHLALSALSFIAKQQPGAPLTPTEEALRGLLPAASRLSPSGILLSMTIVSLA